LEDAIGKYLTRYEYHPIPISLSEDELAEYSLLSRKISILITQQKEDDRETQETLKTLLIKRTRIIAAAEQKLPELLAMLIEHIKTAKRNEEEVRDILVYCAPGTHKDVLKSVADLGLRCHEFVHTVSLSDREKILAQFAKGMIQVLVAIKCLDEGVDVPSTRVAYFLASTTNPRNLFNVEDESCAVFRERQKRKSTILLYSRILPRILIET
jgi:superfamily II DNA or RNA helicase